MDLDPIVDYFELGLEAEIFKDMNTNKPLSKKDNLFWGFNHKGYQYTLRRQPLNTTQNTIGSIMNQIFQSGEKIDK